MPARRSDDRWWTHAPTKPIATEGGLVTSKQRGRMAESWWSNRFVEVLESYNLGGRIQRGRRYARAGQVLTLEVRPAVVSARVQGSRRAPYHVFLELPPPSPDQWEAIETAMTAKVGFAAQLLAGQVPPELEAVFSDAGVDLFPRRWPDLRTECSCPDWGDPCKHVAAALYVLADQLDADPWLLIEWRGRTREDLLAPLEASTAAPGEEVAPWWPFGAGPVPDLPAPTRPAAVATDLGPTAGVLDRLDEIDLDVAGRPLRDVLRPVYELLEAADVSCGTPVPPAVPAERPTPRPPRPSRPPRR